MAGIETPLEQESLGNLFGRLVDDGRDVARAEIDLYKTIAQDRVTRSQSAVALLAVALLLVIAAMVMLLLALADVIGLWLGHAAGALISGLVGFALAGVLAKLAASRLSAAFAPETGR